MDIETLYELGYKMKTTRKSRGLSLDDISLRIKIPTKTLYSLEEALQDGLPQPIYARGFILSYARALEMDMEEVSEQLEKIYPAGDLNNIKADMSHSSREHSAESANPHVKSRSPGIIIVVALIIILLGGFVLYEVLDLDWLNFLKPGDAEAGGRIIR